MSMLKLVQGISKEPHNKLTVIMGKPGSSKTTISGTYPKPLLYVSIDTDGGGEVLKSYSDDEIQTLSIITDKPGPAGAKHAQMKLMELLDELSNEHPYKTIVIDAYSSIEESVVKFLETAKGKRLSLEERGNIGALMLATRDKIVELSRKDVEYVLITHIKNQETTDNTTGEKSIMIIPKMSYNNGNLLLERASNVMYCSKRAVINDDNTRRVAFLTYLGAHPNIDTKLRTYGKNIETGFYVENLTYDKLQEIMKDINKVEKIKVVETQTNPFNEENNENKGENW